MPQRNIFKEKIQRQVRYFHLQVHRPFWSCHIEGLHIAWREIQIMSPGGDVWDHWRGILPLAWRQEKFDPARLGRDVGPEWHADLFAVFDTHPGGLFEDAEVRYAMHKHPTNLPASVSQSHQIRALLEARSYRGLSEWYELRFSWDCKEQRPQAIIFESSSRRTLD